MGGARKGSVIICKGFNKRRTSLKEEEKRQKKNTLIILVLFSSFFFIQSSFPTSFIFLCLVHAYNDHEGTFDCLCACLTFGDTARHVGFDSPGAQNVASLLLLHAGIKHWLLASMQSYLSLIVSQNTP